MSFPSMFRRKKDSLTFLASLAFKDICYQESRHVPGLDQQRESKTTSSIFSNGRQQPESKTTRWIFLNGCQQPESKTTSSIFSNGCQQPESKTTRWIFFNGCCPPKCRQAGRQDPKRPISKSAILARAPIGAIVAVPNVGLDLNIYTLYTIYQFGVRERERERDRERERETERQLAYQFMQKER